MSYGRTSIGFCALLELFGCPQMGMYRRWILGFYSTTPKISRGLVLAQEDLLAGIEPKSMKTGAAKAAEQLLEDVREKHFQALPSRLRCHYLNYDRSVAERRSSDWGWQRRSLERCYIVRSGGYFHHADVAVYEQLAKNPDEVELAFSYWKTFDPKDEYERGRLEVLANSCLYFPDWEQFNEIDRESLVRWDMAYRGQNSGT